MIDVVVFPYAVATLAVGLLATTALLWRTRRALRAEAEAARTRHHELCAGFSELAGAAAALRGQLVQLAEQVERAGATPVALPAAPGGRAYELATRLAASGAASSELVANCGLTPAEADLAVLVHGTRRRASATH